MQRAKQAWKAITATTTKAIIAGTAILAALAVAGLSALSPPPKHAPQNATHPMRLSAAAASDGTVITTAAAEWHLSADRTTTLQPPARPAWVRARRGTTLTALASRICGKAADWSGLYVTNKRRIGPNPALLAAGTNLKVRCFHTYVALPRPPRPRPALVRARVSAPAPAPAPVPPPSGGVLSAAQIGQLWLSEGGSPAAEMTAECIAEHESGGNTQAISPSNDWGLFQINAGGYAMLNAAANTQRAIAMSSNGTNWSAWTTHSMCGV